MPDFEEQFAFHLTCLDLDTEEGLNTIIDELEDTRTSCINDNTEEIDFSSHLDLIDYILNYVRNKLNNLINQTTSMNITSTSSDSSDSSSASYDPEESTTANSSRN